jgi:hypothetical protein
MGCEGVGLENECGPEKEHMHILERSIIGIFF